MRFELNNKSQKDRDGLTRKRRLQFEALETRLMLHGSDEPAQHGDPDHDLTAHVHHHVSIFLEGESVEIPEDLGVHPVNGIIAEVHTHGDDNVLHVHPIGPTFDPLADYTPVSEVFKIWSNPVLSGAPGPNPDSVFGEEIDQDTGHRIRRLMDRVVDLDDPNETHTIRFLVNGVDHPRFDEYLMHDGDQIVISYEQKVQPGFPRLNPMANLTMAGGQTFHVPLAARDPDFGPISYDVSVSDPRVTAEIISGGNSVVLTVSAVDESGTEFTGMITIRLFETLSPDTAARFIELVEQGYYDGLIFHRIIDGFVAQFGSSDGRGGQGSGVMIPDEYDPSLVFNGYAQLAMAKRGDNSGDAQGFITDTNLSLNMSSSPRQLPPQHLNFNHTIFGQVVDGFRTLNRIMGTAVTGSTPDSPVVIDAARYLPDTGTGVLRLTAEPGFVGKVDVIVTAEDVEGKSAARTFVMDVIPPSHNSNPFLDRLDPIHTPMGTPISVPLNPVDIDGDPIEVNVFLSGTENALESVTVTPSVVTPDGFTASATLNITPRDGFVGTTQFWLGVHRDEFSAADGFPPNYKPNPVVTNDHSFADFQVVEVVIDPLIASPASIDLLPPSDTGASSIDNVTRRNNTPGQTLSLAVGGVEQGALVKLFADGTVIGEATATTQSVIITTEGTHALTDGSHTLTATQTVDGLESGPTPVGLTIFVDASPPSFTSPSIFEAIAGADFQADTQTDDESELGVAYTLIDAPSGMAIGSDTGLIRWTPGLGQLGENTATVRATDLAGNENERTLTINVAQPPPTSIDLLAVSDTGQSSSDNITRLNNTGGQGLRFEVQGVAADGLVRLFADGLLIGQGTAAGDSIIITTDGTTTLPDGSHTLTATQTVGGSESAATPVGLTILVDASLPGFTSSSVFDAAVGVDSHTDVDTDDESELGVEYTLIGAPLGMTIEPGSGEIHWTPSSAQLGVHTVTVHATDLAGNENEQSLTVNVVPPPPTSIDLLAVSDTGQSSSDDVTGLNNTGGQGLRFEVQGVSADSLVRLFVDGLLIGQGTATGESIIITTDGTTAIPDGLRSITATQSVDGLEGTHSPPLVITIDTLRPLFTSAPDLTVLVGESYTYNADTDDEFTSGASYSLLENPDGMTIDAQSGEIRWTPAPTQNGSHPVVVHAVDRVGNDRTQSFTLNVDVNEAPVIEAIAPITAPEGELVSFLFEADDPNLPNDQLSWSLGPGAPAGMTIDSSTGRVSWIPGEADGPGAYEVTVRTTDQGGLFDEQTVSITVTEVNRPPVLDPIPDQTLTSGETLRLTASASDTDLPAQAVRYSVESDAPGTLSMDPVSGEFIWTAPSSVTGRFDFTFHAEDAGSPRLTSSRSFSVAVSGGVDDVSFGVVLAERSRQILDGLPRRAANLVVPPLPGFVPADASSAGGEVSGPAASSGPRPLITTGAGGGMASRAKTTNEAGEGEQNQGTREDAPPAEGEEQPENEGDPLRGRLEDRGGQEDPRETVELSPEAVDRILAELAGTLAP